VTEACELNQQTCLFGTTTTHRPPSRFCSKLVPTSRPPRHIRFPSPKNASHRRPVHFSGLRFVELPTRDHLVRKTHFATIRFLYLPIPYAFSIAMPPKAGSGGKARANNAHNDSAPQQRTIQTRSARAGLQVRPAPRQYSIRTDILVSSPSVVYTVI
jgi:hypothetical protein